MSQKLQFGFKPLAGLMTTWDYVHLLNHADIPYFHCRCDYEHFSFFVIEAV